MNNISTDLVVDKSYHQNLATLNQKNPLVHNLLLEYRPSMKKTYSNLEENEQTDEEQTQDNWKDTYSLACNMVNLHKGEKASRRGIGSKAMKVTELEKLCMTLQMSYHDSKPIHTEYVYKPKYMVYDELYMVVRNYTLLDEFSPQLCSDNFFIFLI